MTDTTAAPTAPTSVTAAFKQKTRKDRNVRASLLSFDQEEEQQAAEVKQRHSGPPPSSASLATHDNEHKEDEEPSVRRPKSPVTRPSQRAVLAGVSEQDDDDVAAMQAVAAMHERRQRRQQQLQHDHRRRPAAQLSSTSTTRPRRPLHSVTIGDGDYDTTDYTNNEQQQQQEGGEYSAEKLAALRLNAVHIGPTHTPSPPPAHTEAVMDDDGDNTLTEREQRIVRAAKAQRARNRTTTADVDSDYIPLTTTTAAQHRPQQHIADDEVIRIDDDDDDEGSGRGTLMRGEEEDNIVDVTMEARVVAGGAGRLMFGDDGRQKRREKTRQEITDTLNTSEREEVEVEEEEVDSEMEEWEVEQLKKGGVRVAERTTVPPSQPSTSHTRDTAAPTSLQLSLASLSLTSLQSSLQSSLSTLHHTNSATQSALTSLATRLSSSRTTLATLSSSLDTLNERYQFYQQQREWVTVWSGMMGEKVSDIDEAWQEMSNMRHKRGEEMQARLRQYRRDEREETGLVAEVAGGSVVELDEYGRDLGYVREMDRDRRNNIRAAVRQLSQQRRDVSTSTHSQTERPQLDGQVNDDELYDEVEGVAAVQQAARVSFVDDVRGIMADVDDEWRSVDRVITHFQHWRRRDLQSYNDVYVSLTLPKLLAPYVRIDLMLNTALQSTDSNSWSGLSSVVKLLVSGCEERSVGVQLMADIVLLWLCDVVKWDWNVRSTLHATWLYGMLDELNTAFTSHNDNEQSSLQRYGQSWQQLCDVVVGRLRSEVDEWQPLLTTVDGGGQLRELHLRAIVRECVRGAKLLRVLSDWRRRLAEWDVQPNGQLIGDMVADVKNMVERQRSNVDADVRVLRQQMLRRGGDGTVVAGMDQCAVRLAQEREIETLGEVYEGEMCRVLVKVIAVLDEKAEVLRKSNSMDD